MKSINIKAIAFLILACCSLLCEAQQVISGVVTDSLGNPIFKASVKEMDRERRILNQTNTDKRGHFVLAVSDTARGLLRVDANGYYTSRDRITRNRQKYSFKLQERFRSRISQYVSDNKGKSNYVQSMHLLCGKMGSRETPWLVTIEQLNDTLYTLQLPVFSNANSGMYKEGRTMCFLNANGYPLCISYNAEDAIGVEGPPNIYDRNSLKEAQSIGYYREKPATQLYAQKEDVYFYPLFILSQEEIDILLEQSANISHITVDTENGDNYWHVYPMDDFDKELRKIITKLNKKRWKDKQKK